VEIKIEKNIPIPEKNTGLGHRIYRWETMEIGDSFQLEGEYKKVYHRLFSQASKYRKANPDFNFTIRETEKGGRIWRVKPEN
jgi:hypothetical protein